MAAAPAARRGSALNSGDEPIEGMESVIATVSGYRDEQKQRLVQLINRVGAVYCAELQKKHTHVICWEFSGKKYDLAVKWGKKIVNHRWLEECFRCRFYVPEDMYRLRCGRDVGPLVWKEKEKDLSKKQYLGVAEFKPMEGEPIIVDLEGFPRAVQVPTGTSKGKEVADCSRKEVKTRASQKTYKEMLALSGKRKLPIEAVGRGSKVKLRQKKVDNFVVAAKPPTVSRPETSRAISQQLECIEPPDVATVVAGHDEYEIPRHEEGRRLSTSSASSLEIKCAICHDAHDSQAEGLLHCGHEFCFDCIAKWADQATASGGATCPLCKAPFDVITKRETVPCDGGLDKCQESIVLVGKSQLALKHSTRWPPQELSCIICNSLDTTDLLLTCSRCHLRAVHTFCLDPPWSGVTTPWSCRLCSEHR